MKNFNIGDKVQFIDGNVKGTILQLTSYKALIKDEDGFEEEVLISNLCLQANSEDYNLNNDNVLVAIERKEFLHEEKKRSKANIKRTVLEVDLHIHLLTSSTRNMSNHDMVLLQLKTCKNAILNCDKTRYNKIVLIHGVGSGKLRTEIENELRRLKLNYQDGSFDKYGSGALEIIL